MFQPFIFLLSLLMPTVTLDHKTFIFLLLPTNSLSYWIPKVCLPVGLVVSSVQLLCSYQKLLENRGFEVFLNVMCTILHEQAIVLVREVRQCSLKGTIKKDKSHTQDQVIIISNCRTLGQIPHSKQPLTLVLVHGSAIMFLSSGSVPVSSYAALRSAESINHKAFSRVL